MIPYHVVLVQKKDKERGINYPGSIKTPDSSRGHKISTRDGSVLIHDLTYKFWNMDHSSPGVFFLKNQTEVNYSLGHRARTASPLLYFRSPQDCQPHPLVPSLAVTVFTFGALLWRYRELKF
jgi:hypothetical protein